MYVSITYMGICTLSIVNSVKIRLVEGDSELPNLQG